jgi:hypothetical protein
MSPLPLRRLALVPVVGALLAAGCQDFPGQTDPGRVKTVTTGTKLVTAKSGPWTGTVPANPRTVTGSRILPATTGTVIWTGTVLPRRAITGGTHTVTDTVIGTRTFVVTTTVVSHPGVDARNGVPILEAILANPIKADNEYRNRTVRLQGLGTVGRDARGYFITFPTTAVAPGELKPHPGIVARIAPGEEAAFADLKRDATVTIYAIVRTWRTDVPETYRGVVIEMDQARLMSVAHAGY